MQVYTVQITAPFGTDLRPGTSNIRVDGSGQLNPVVSLNGVANSSLVVNWTVTSGSDRIASFSKISGTQNLAFRVKSDATVGTATFRATSANDATKFATYTVSVIKPANGLGNDSVSSPDATLYDYTDPSGNSAKIAYLSRNTSLTLNVAIDPSDATNTDVTNTQTLTTGLGGETVGTFMTVGTKTKSSATTSIPVSIKDVDISGSKLIMMSLRPSETYYAYTPYNVFFIVVESAPTSTLPISFVDGRVPFTSSGEPVGANALVADASGAYKYAMKTTEVNVPLFTAVIPSTAAQDVSWSSSNTAVATVSGDGYIGAVLSVGETVITATSKQDPTKFSTIRIAVTGATIEPVSMSEIVATRKYTDSVGSAGSVVQPTLQPDSTYAVMLPVSNAFDLSALIYPSNVDNSGVVWTSDQSFDGDYLTLSEAGVISGVAEGTVTVTATSAANSSLTKTVKIVVFINVAVTGITQGGVYINNNGLNLHVNNSIIYGDASGNMIVKPSSLITVHLIAGDGIVPSNATNKQINYTLSDASFGTLSAASSTNGMTTITTGATEGVYTLTATTAEGGFSRSFNFRVMAYTDVSGITDISSNVVPVSDASLNDVLVTRIAAGSTLQLTSDVIPADAYFNTLLWAIYDKDDYPYNNTVPAGFTQQPSAKSTGAGVSIDASGLFTATATSSGYVFATASAGGKTSQPFYIYVEAVAATPVSGITVTAAGGVTTIGLNSTDESTIKGTVQLSATAAPENATNKAVTWSSSDSAVATVNSPGLATAVAPGSATITATANDGSAVYGTYELTVVRLVTGITVASANNATSVDVSGTLLLSATIAPNDATTQTVSWSSSNTSVATIDAYGLVSGVAGGEVTITATATDGSNKSANFYLSVVKPATGLAPFTIDISGDATTYYPTTDASGVYTFSVEQGKYFFLNTSVLPVDATNQDVTIAKKKDFQSFNAMAYITRISNPANGRVQFYALNLTDNDVVEPDVVTVQAYPQSDETLKQYIRFTVTEAQAQTVAASGVTVAAAANKNYVVAGSTLQLSATVAPSDATDKSVSWSSSDETKATVDSSGIVSGVAAGQVSITATTTSGGHTASITLNIVTTYVQITDVAVQAARAGPYRVGETLQMSYTYLPLDSTDNRTTWSTSNAGVATVDASGLVSFVGVGTVAITATAIDNTSSAAGSYSGFYVYGATDVILTGLAVSPSSATVAVGATETLTAVATPANTTNQSVTWSSSNTAIATVDAYGVVSAVAAGSATITATSVTDGTITATAAITVPTPTIPVSGVSVSGSTLAMSVGGSTQSLAATVSPADATNTAVSWSSSDSAVASVDVYGVVTAVSNGSATITATSQADGTKTGSYGPIVVSTPVSSVTVSAAGGATTLPTGQTLQLSAAVLPATASNPTVVWSIASRTGAAAASINSSTGLLTAGANAGSVSIVATAGGVASTGYAVTITAPVLVSGIVVSGTTLAMTVGGSTQSLTAAVSPANAANKALAWSSSNTAVATVSVSGVVTAVANGSATITATSTDGSNVAGSYGPITVTTLVSSVAIVDASGATSKTLTDRGQTVQLVATVSPVGASNTAITWASSNTAVATVSVSGLVTAVDSGSATITATSVEGSKVSNAYSLTVSIPVASVDISGPLTMTVGDVSGWSLSFLPAYATNQTTTWTATGAISVNSSGSVTAVSAGSGTLKATVGGVNSTIYTVTVQNGITIPTIVADITFDASSCVYTSVEDGVPVDASAGIFNDGNTTRDFIILNTSVSAAPGQSLSVSWTTPTGVTVEPLDASSNRVKIFLRPIVSNNLRITARSVADPTVFKQFVLRPIQRPERLSIGSTSVTISKGAASVSSDPLNPTVINLNAVLEPAGTPRRTVSWSADVSGIVSFDVSGDQRYVAVSCVGGGAVRITAISSDNPNARATITLTVQMVGTVSQITRADGLPLNTTVRQGAPVEIYVSRMPANAAISTNPKTAWTTSDAKSLTVALLPSDPANPSRIRARITAVAAPEKNNATITFTGRNSALETITRTGLMGAFIPIATVAGVVPSISQPFVGDNVQMSVGTYLPLNASDTTFRWYVLDAANAKSSPRLPATSPAPQNATIDMNTGVLTCLKPGIVSVFGVANEITNIATLTAKDSGKKFNKIDITIFTLAPGLNIYTSDASGASTTILRYNKIPLKINYTLNGTLEQAYFMRYTTGGKSIVVNSNGATVSGVPQDPSGVVYICAQPNQPGVDSLKVDVVDAAGKIISIRQSNGSSIVLTKSLSLNVATSVTSLSADATLYGIARPRGPNSSRATGSTFTVGARTKTTEVSVALISDASNVSWPSPIPNNVGKGPAGSSNQTVIWTQQSGPVGIISYKSGSPVSRLVRIRPLTTAETAANPSGIPIVLKARSFDGNFEATVTLAVF